MHIATLIANIGQHLRKSKESLKISSSNCYWYSYFNVIRTYMLKCTIHIFVNTYVATYIATYIAMHVYNYNQ